MTVEPIFPTVARPPRGPHRLSAEEVALAQRGRLLTAMVRLVADHGLAGTKLSELVREAGVSRSTFYELFEDKHACWLAAYDQFTSVLFARMADQVAEASDWHNLIDRVVNAFLAVLEAEPIAARAAVVESDTASRETSDRLRDTYLAFASLLHDRYDEFRRTDPSLVPLPPRVLVGIVFGIRELARQALINDPTTLSDVAKDARLWVHATTFGAAALSRKGAR